MQSGESRKRSRGRGVLVLAGLGMTMALVAAFSISSGPRGAAVQAGAMEPPAPPPRRRRGLTGSILTKSLVVLVAVVMLGLSTRGTALAVASVAFQSAPSTTTCGSAQNIGVSVYDTNGFPAPNNTPVTFSTTLGYITTPGYTDGNLATVSLVIPPKQSGTATITASALGISGTKSIAVTCASTAPAPVIVSAAPGPVLAQLPVAPVIAAAPAVVAAPAPTSMSVSVTEFSYTPASFNVRVGQPVSLNITNAGRLNHTFTIAGVTDSGAISGGGSRSVSFTPSQAGTLTFYCTIHGANVMSGRITVTP